MNIAVLASGNGSNFEAIADAVKQGRIKACLKLLVTDKEDAYVRTRAKNFGVRDIFVSSKDHASRQDFDKAVVDILRKEDIGLVVLAGFMRIITPLFVDAFPNKILNIHPALLPSFKGVDSIKEAYAYGAKVTGVTVHFVDEQTDHGPVIIQQAVAIEPGQALEALEEKIHQVEHKLYPEAIRLFVDGKLRVSGRKVVITDLD
ncbi:phosphoribosylglycinamide formyltransferase [Candidatus Omnitrophota bacterium]